MNTVRRVLYACLTAAALALLVFALAAGQSAPALPLRGTGSGRAWSVPELTLPSGTVSVNSAGLYELTELPGVGETLAQAILDEREANGPFRVPEDLLSVKGIGAKKLAQFRDWLDMSLPEE